MNCAACGEELHPDVAVRFHHCQHGFVGPTEALTVIANLLKQQNEHLETLNQTNERLQTILESMAERGLR
jgi:hypothetical protein